MRKLLFIIICVITYSLNANAQQEVRYTKYMFNKKTEIVNENTSTTPTLSPSLKVYPNPTTSKGIIDIHIPNNSSSSFLLLYDMQGRLLQQFHLLTSSTNSISLNMEPYNNGFYVLQLIVDGEVVGVEKLIKE